MCILAYLTEVKNVIYVWNDEKVRVMTFSNHKVHDYNMTFILYQIQSFYNCNKE